MKGGVFRGSSESRSWKGKDTLLDVRLLGTKAYHMHSWPLLCPVGHLRRLQTPLEKQRYSLRYAR